MRVLFPATLGMEIRCSRRTSSGGALNLEANRNSRGRATIQKDLVIPVHPRYTCFPWTDSNVTSGVESKHDVMCDSPVTPREKTTDPYVNSTGSATRLLQLRRKADLHVSIREEA